MKRNFPFALIVFISVLACRLNKDSEKKVSSLSIETAPETAQLFAEDIVSTRYNERDMAIRWKQI
ncbi:MAG: hypothetical protein ABJB16_14475 [Saprospiraceae bacterium]